MIYNMNTSIRSCCSNTSQRKRRTRAGRRGAIKWLHHTRHALLLVIIVSDVCLTAFCTTKGPLTSACIWTTHNKYVRSQC